MHETTDFTDRIWNYVEDSKDPDLELHLQSCADCREEHGVLEGLAAARSVGEIPPVPDTLASTLNELFAKVRPDLAQPKQRASSVTQRVKTFFAELLHDTGVHPQIVGLRGEGRTRQIAFTSDVADLDLEVSPDNGQFLVVGQLGMDDIPEDLSIRFVPANTDPVTPSLDEALASSLSEQGYFRIIVAPGDWLAAVDIDDAVVLFPGIQL